MGKRKKASRGAGGTARKLISQAVGSVEKRLPKDYQKVVRDFGKQVDKGVQQAVKQAEKNGTEVQKLMTRLSQTASRSDLAKLEQRIE